MKIHVKVKPNSGKQKVEKKDSEYIVYLKSKPIDNKANIELLKVLEEYFGKRVEITSGLTGKKKIVEISRKV